ncbi:MAG: DUF3023 domain-containing protein [Ehrlichia sp.]
MLRHIQKSLKKFYFDMARELSTKTDVRADFFHVNHENEVRSVLCEVFCVLWKMESLVPDSVKCVGHTYNGDTVITLSQDIYGKQLMKPLGNSVFMVTVAVPSNRFLANPELKGYFDRKLSSKQKKTNSPVTCNVFILVGRNDITKFSDTYKARGNLCCCGKVVHVEVHTGEKSKKAREESVLKILLEKLKAEEHKFTENAASILCEILPIVCRMESTAPTKVKCVGHIREENNYVTMYSNGTKGKAGGCIQPSGDSLFKACIAVPSGRLLANTELQDHFLVYSYVKA